MVAGGGRAAGAARGRSSLVVSLVFGALAERVVIRRFEGQEPLVAIVATVAC